MANSILYSEINAVCVGILVLLSIKVKSSMFLQEQRHTFVKVTISNAVLLLLDCVWIFVNNNVLGLPVSLNWRLNGLYYMVSGILGFYWFQYSETIQNSELIREKKYRKYIYAPVVLLILLTICSFRTGWLFYVDENNIYHRGPGYVLQLLTSYGYVVFTAGKAFYLSFRTDDYRKKYELKALAAFVVPTLVTGLLQVLFPGYPILCLGNTYGILYVYLTLQEQLVSLDALTKLNNRNQLFQYLSAKLDHIHEDKVLYLLIMDVDYFKSINDQYGHVEGDHALKTVANCLRKACSSKNYFISRYGGDEFVAICELDPSESIDTFCNHIHENLKAAGTPYQLTISIGYTTWTPDIRNQQDFIERADQELYKIKKNRSNRRER